jgi:hypothetical protein
MEIYVNDLMNEIEIFYKTCIMNELIEMITPYAKIELPSITLVLFTKAIYDYMVSDDDCQNAEISLKIENIQAAFKARLSECKTTDLNSSENYELDRQFDLMYFFVRKAVANFIIAKFNPENEQVMLLT